MYLPWSESKARLREAENARRNRQQFLAAWSQGQISRRDLVKLGLLTAAGTVIFKNGLSPFAQSAFAGANIPTGLPPSPLFGVKPFTQPMLRFDVLPRNPVSTLSPAPTAEANTTQQLLNTALEGVKPGDTGPIEGRPPGPIWAHQGFNDFPPRVAIEVTEEGAKTNTVYDPGVAASLNSGIGAGSLVPAQFHPGLPTQGPLAVWTFNGTFPPKLVQVRYGEHLQLTRSWQRGDQRRRQSPPAERHGQVVGQPRLRRQPHGRGQGLGREWSAQYGHLRFRWFPRRSDDG